MSEPLLSNASFTNSSISNGFSGADSSTSTSANIFNNLKPSLGNLSFPILTLTKPSTLQQFECMKEWVRFDSMTRTDIEWVTKSTDYSYSLAIVQTYGIGDVYTTTDGIPVARGTFTPTRTVTSTAWRIEHATFSVPSPGTKWLQSTPPCTSPGYWQQQSLCATYLSSLGLVQNGTAVNPVPATITPVSFDSSLCPLPYTDNTTCETRIYSYSSCYLEGRSVELYYFPPQTAIATEPKPGITTSVIYSFAPNITFTSPSIYLSFDYLTAFSYPPLEAGKCTQCYSGFCMSWDLELGYGHPYTLSAVGTVITNRILSLPLNHVSTVIISTDPSSESGIADALAHFSWASGDQAFQKTGVLGIPDYIMFRNQQLELADLAHPPPTAYYLNYQGAPGCGSWGVGSIGPECSTIFEDLYRPLLALPPDIAHLQSLWKGCYPVYGVSDPPIALTTTTLILVSTEPGGIVHLTVTDTDTNTFMTLPAIKHTPGDEITAPTEAIAPARVNHNAASTGAKSQQPHQTGSERGSQRQNQHPGGNHYHGTYPDDPKARAAASSHNQPKPHEYSENRNSHMNNPHGHPSEHESEDERQKHHANPHVYTKDSQAAKTKYPAPDPSRGRDHDPARLNALSVLVSALKGLAPPWHSKTRSGHLAQAGASPEVSSGDPEWRTGGLAQTVGVGDDAHPFTNAHHHSGPETTTDAPARGHHSDPNRFSFPAQLHPTKTVGLPHSHRKDLSRHHPSKTTKQNHESSLAHDEGGHNSKVHGGHAKASGDATGTSKPIDSAVGHHSPQPKSDASKKLCSCSAIRYVVSVLSTIVVINFQ